MKRIWINLLFILFSINGFAQSIKVAILDFENTSGKTEYDALGKAMSSMLITDLGDKIHPKKVEFFERSQLNKLLDEQNLQRSKNFDAKTAVDFGKLSGVNYVFVGSVFVMDGNCAITSNLVDVETSKIVLSKEANGKIETWLQLKSQLAEAISVEFNNPITLEPSYKDQTTTLATLNQFGKVLSIMDEGDFEKAEQFITVFEETNPDFRYFKNLSEEIIKLQKEIKVIKERLADVMEPEKIAIDLINQNREIDKALEYLDVFDSRVNYANAYGETKKLFVCYQKARAYYRLGDFKKSMAYYDSTLSIDPNFHIGLWVKMRCMMGGDLVDLPENVVSLKPDRDYSNEIEECFVKITGYGKKNISSFNPRVYRRSSISKEECDNIENEECDFFSYGIKLPNREYRTIFDLILDDIEYRDMHQHIIRPANLYARYLISVGQTKKARLILENTLFQHFEFLEGTEADGLSELYYQRKDRTFNFLAADSFRDYVNLENKFNPIFIEHEPNVFISGGFNHEPENDGFTDNIVLLSNLLILERRYSDAVNLLMGFRNIFGEYEYNGWIDGKDYYNVDNFKVSLNLYLLSKLAGAESLKLREQCRQIYNQEKYKIGMLYEGKSLSYEQFLDERYMLLDEFFANEEIANGLRNVLVDIETD